MAVPAQANELCLLFIKVQRGVAFTERALEHCGDDHTGDDRDLGGWQECKEGGVSAARHPVDVWSQTAVRRSEHREQQHAFLLSRNVH